VLELAVTVWYTVSKENFIILILKLIVKSNPIIYWDSDFLIDELVAELSLLYFAVTNTLLPAFLLIYKPLF
jgi:hypothetical protein